MRRCCYQNTRPLRQALGAAKRWRHVIDNPAVEHRVNAQPRAEEIRSFTRSEVEVIVAELAPENAAIVQFGAETRLRNNEWTGTERRDTDLRSPAIAVARRYSRGQLTPTQRPSAEGCGRPSASQATQRAVSATATTGKDRQTKHRFAGDS